jgi:hypothetical protein
VSKKGQKKTVAKGGSRRKMKAGKAKPTKKETPVVVKKATTRFNMIANQMVHGFGTRKQITNEEMEAFKERYREVIEWVDTHMPTKISVGVLGAIGKAVLWYGREKMEPFCKALRYGDFQGHGNPAHVLWLWLLGRARYNAKDAYRRTVTAIRYYCDGRQIVRTREGEQVRPNMEPAYSDLFEWDRSFTMMLRRHTNKSRTEFKSVFGETPSAEEIKIAEKVEEALVTMRD